MVELGRIKKPAIDSFAGRRKLYMVRSVHAPAGSTDEFKGLIRKYWDDVLLQVGKLEAAGKIQKIFCEQILSADEHALKEFAGHNEGAVRLIMDKVAGGAILYPLENEEIYRQMIDWRNCLEVVVTREVFETVLGFYRDLIEKRLEHLRKVIEENLEKEEAGLLISAEEDKTRFFFSEDIALFSVIPPSYDDILKQIRDRKKETRKEGL
jgi:hypothetical protein